MNAAPNLPERSDPGGYALAVAGAAAGVAVAALAERWLGLRDLSLVFMLAVLVVAVRSRTGPAVLTALLCFLSYNFFFIEPRYTFYIDAGHSVSTVLLFLAAALIAGRLASRLAMKVDALEAANRHVDARRRLGWRLAAAADNVAIVAAAKEVFRESMDATVWVRVGDQSLHADGVEPHPPASNAALRRGRIPENESVQDHGWWFLPLPGAEAPLGLIGVKLPAHRAQPDDDDRALGRAMASDIAQALERARLVQDLARERTAVETERLRSALLSSVSHDLRTPLSAVIGAAESLKLYGHSMDTQDRTSLLQTVLEEGQRLDLYIQNLLDMTRLDSNPLAFDRDWIGVDELVGAAVGRLRRYERGVRVDVGAVAASAPVRVNAVLLEQALFNVLDNAARFAPAGSRISVVSVRGDDHFTVDVIDQGPGIPLADRSRVFDKFFSADRGDRGQGAGLGLAISRGIVSAHGGEIAALSGPDGTGTCIRIRLPVEPLPDPAG